MLFWIGLFGAAPPMFYTKRKVVDDDRLFCREVPKFLHPALKQKGVFMELDIYEASLQFANAFSLHYLQSISPEVSMCV